MVFFDGEVWTGPQDVPTTLDNLIDDGALSQSGSVWQDEVPAAILGADLRGTRAYVEVGAQEWVLVPLHRPVVESLRAAGAEVASVEFNGGHDYACWRGGIADGLRRLNYTIVTADSSQE
ncbi:hypothetical protein [Nocardia mangyaensis]|uniref:hypothetical protein n=1 Tax=Nocardia mangyaensis TaxID=2213200 RepID=UPI0012ECAC07|nr:hypothetical protein [Nocardia mangyaensis]